MTTLMNLPDEVIDIILSYNDISFEDIINFVCVCKRFQWAAKTYFFQRWSSAKKYYDEQSKKNKQKQSKENENGDGNPTSFIETGIDCAKKLRNADMRIYVQEKLIKCARADEILLEICFEKKLGDKNSYKLISKNKNYIKILFFMDEFKHLLDQPVRANCDLTDRYCYIKLFDSLRICWRNDVLKRYIEEQSYKEQLYKELSEQSATTWAQQLQLRKNISYSSVKASLKSIALEVLNSLREKHPEHSIFSTPDEYISHWENNKIDDNYWEEADGIQIIETLVKYLFDKLRFRPTISTELEYFCIDYVLENKHGNEIILYIIYESVARRLGLRCDIMESLESSSSSTIELFWMPKYAFPTDYKNNICLLNKEHKENMRFIQLTNFNQSANDIFKFYNFSTRVMYKKTPAEILKSIIDIKLTYDFTNFSNGSLTYHLKCVVFKARPKYVKFAVGMIVTHGDESKDCSTGVIVGWHQNDCGLLTKMNIISYATVPLKMCSYISAKQTYYIILTKSDKMCCVKEDDIALTKPNWIENRNVYYYFSKFKGTHYVPNEELAEVYPHDAAIAAKKIFKG